MPVIDIPRDSTYEKFLQYASFHHNGDVCAALDELLFAHKAIDTIIHKLVQCETELSRRKNNGEPKTCPPPSS